jgi:putative ABC transport system substrate-binding protein
MRRREFIMLLSCAAAIWPLAARAQQPERVRRVGVLVGLAENDPEMKERIAGLRQGLEKLGWAEGSNLRIDYARGLRDPCFRRSGRSHVLWD